MTRLPTSGHLLFSRGDFLVAQDEGTVPILCGYLQTFASGFLRRHLEVEVAALPFLARIDEFQATSVIVDGEDGMFYGVDYVVSVGFGDHRSWTAEAGFPAADEPEPVTSWGDVPRLLRRVCADFGVDFARRLNGLGHQLRPLHRARDTVSFVHVDELGLRFAVDFSLFSQEGSEYAEGVSL